MANVRKDSSLKSADLKKDAELYAYEGVSMTKDVFSDYFSGLPQSRTGKSLAGNSVLTKMNILNIEVQNDGLSMSICLQKDSGVENINLTGKLRRSYKAENGENSIIFEAEDTKEYTVLLCEIYNDSKAGKLLLESTKQYGFEGKPHLKMYIADRANKLFLYEGILPDIFKTLNAQNYPLANCYKDIYWAWNYVKHELKRIPTDTVNNSLETVPTQRALGSYSIRSYKETFYFMQSIAKYL